MKKILFLIAILFTNPVLSQPIVKIWGTEDTLTVQQQIAAHLAALDIWEPVYIMVDYTTQIPETLEGITFCLNPTTPTAHPIIKVKVNARLGKKKQELVLAHEMVHVKQYVKGELMVDNEQQVFWKGRKYGNRNADYLQSPWENEAYQQDNQLTLQWKKQQKDPLNAQAPLTASHANPH